MNLVTSQGATGRSLLGHGTTWCTTYGNRALLQGRHEWTIQIEKLPEPWYLMLGVVADEKAALDACASQHIGQSSAAAGVALHARNGSLYFSGTSTPINKEAEFREGDVVTLVLDFVQRTLSFFVTKKTEPGRNKLVAVATARLGLPLDAGVGLRPAVSLAIPGTRLTLLSMDKPKTTAAGASATCQSLADLHCF